MGARTSKENGQVVAVRMDELSRMLDERLQAKYVRGMRGVLPAVTSALGIFVALQQIAIEISDAVNAKLAACNEGRAGLQLVVPCTGLQSKLHAALISCLRAGPIHNVN